MKTTRRNFFKLSTSAALAAILAKNPVLASQLEEIIAQPPQKPVPKRPLGNLGVDLSVVGFGGIVVKGVPQKTADKSVADAVAAGVNYFDVAPTYGNAEVRLGPALKPYRKDVFLACKSNNRTAKGTKKRLDNSLKRLKTDYFDLYQLHAIKDVEEDVKASLAKGGAMEAILEAQKAGIIKHIGFSAHTPEAAIYAMENFDFDTMLYPVNFCCHYQGNFDQRALAKAREKNVAILTLKAMAKQKRASRKNRPNWPKTWYEPVADPKLARMALEWTLSRAGAISAIPPGDERLFRLAMDIASRLEPASDTDEKELKRIAKDLDPIFTA